jgi:hypothetical protein
VVEETVWPVAHFLELETRVQKKHGRSSVYQCVVCVVFVLASAILGHQIIICSLEMKHKMTPRFADLSISAPGIILRFPHRRSKFQFHRMAKRFRVVTVVNGCANCPLDGAVELIGNDTC